MNLTDFCRRMLQTESTPNQERQVIQLAAQEMDDLDTDDVTVDSHGI